MPEPPCAAAPRRDGLGVVLLGAALAFAASWAATRSGAASTTAGRPLGRLDGAAAVAVVVAVAGVVQSLVRRLDATGRGPGREVGRTVLRRVLLPWWLVVTVATFGYPTAAGLLVPDDAAMPTWVVVVRDWLVASPLARPEGGAAWAGRLPTTWVVLLLLTGVAVSVAVVLVAARRTAATAAERVLGVAVPAGSVLLVVGVALRLLVATTEATGWGVVVRAAPPAHLDLIGLGLLVGAVVTAAQQGRGPLAAGLDAARAGAPRLVAVTAAALVAGAAAPGSGSLLDPGGVVPTAVARVGLLLVGGGLALWGLLPAPASAPPWWVGARGLVGRHGLDAWLTALVASPLVVQLWATRAGGAPGTQTLGPMVLVGVAGSAVAGLAVGAAGRAVFGVDWGRTLPRFAVRLATVTGLALAWRLLTLVGLNRRNPSGGDPFFYHHQANMLADRVGYSEPFRWVEAAIAVPSAIHPPLLSTWLSVGSVLGARTFLAHKALAALLGVGAVIVAALIARRLAGDRAGLVAAVLVAVYPNLWVIDGALWPEGVYTTVIGLAVLAAYRWWERPDLGRAAVLGGVIALAALARGEALFLYPLLVAPVVLRRRGIGLGVQLRAGLVAGLVGLVVLAPWTLRTRQAFDEWILLSTNSDEVLYYANCPDSYGLIDERPAGEGAPPPTDELLGYWSFNCQQRERARAGLPVASESEAALYRRCLGPEHEATFDGTIPGEPPGDEVDKARYWRCLATEFVSENGDRLPVVVAARIGRELDVYRPSQGLLFLEIEGRPRGVARVGQLAWWVLAPVGLAGWVALRRRRVLVYPLVSLGLMVLATTVYAYGAVRFRTPLELGLLIGAGVAVDALVRRVRPSGEEPT